MNEKTVMLPKTINRAAVLAGFNGWTLVIFAAISIIFSQSITSIVLTLLFALLGWRELQGRRQMKKLDAWAPALLAINQILLAVVIIGYCAWNIFLLKTHPGKYLSQLDAYPKLMQAMRQQGVDFKQLVLRLSIISYCAVAAASLITQAFMALYYLTRKKYIVDQ